MSVHIASMAGDDTVEVLKYLIDHIPSIVTAVIGGLILLRQSKGEKEIKKTVGKVAATVRKDSQKVVEVTLEQHKETQIAIADNTEMTKATKSEIEQQTQDSKATYRHVKNNEENTKMLRKAMEDHGIKCPPHIESNS